MPKRVSSCTYLTGKKEKARVRVWTNVGYKLVPGHLQQAKKQAQETNDKNSQRLNKTKRHTRGKSIISCLGGGGGVRASSPSQNQRDTIYLLCMVGVDVWCLAFTVALRESRRGFPALSVPSKPALVQPVRHGFGGQNKVPLAETPKSMYVSTTRKMPYPIVKQCTP